jgi:hypothetical protein
MITDVADIDGIKELGWKIELLEATGAAHTEMINRMKYLDTLKVRSLGFPERSILEGQHGTLAEAEAHGSLAALAINTRRIDITNAVNWHGVNHYVRVNWGEKYENRVWLTLNPINDVSIKFLQSVYQTLISGSQVSAELQRSLDSTEMADRLRIPLRSQAEIDALPPLPPDAPILEQQRVKPKPGDKNYIPPVQ